MIVHDKFVMNTLRKEFSPWQICIRDFHLEKAGKPLLTALLKNYIVHSQQDYLKPTKYVYWS